MGMCIHLVFHLNSKLVHGVSGFQGTDNIYIYNTLFSTMVRIIHSKMADQSVHHSLVILDKNILIMTDILINHF
jgi:hypothetical protein